MIDTSLLLLININLSHSGLEEGTVHWGDQLQLNEKRNSCY